MIHAFSLVSKKSALPTTIFGGSATVVSAFKVSAQKGLF